MSYLLDALRRAEREREAQSAPHGLQARSSAHTAGKARPMWPFVLLGFAGALVLVSAALWLTRPPPAAATVSVAPPSPAPAVPSLSEQVETPSTVETLDTLMDPEAIEPLALSEAEALEEEASATAPPEAPAAEPAEPEAPRHQSLREMSPDYRASFPKLNLDVHAYDADPAQSFVMVNGRRYRNGETLTEGPRISAILPEGLLLQHNGQSVLIGVGG